MTEQQPMSLNDFLESAKAQIREVTPEQLEAMIGEIPDLLVIDVREPGEHGRGHLKDAMLVPRGILEAAADAEYAKRNPVLSAARERPLALYCATGVRSALATLTLQMMGFSNVVNVLGGFTRWNQENRPIVREASFN